MDYFSFISPNVMQYLVIPVLIMLARICDVSIGTIRIICVARGRKLLASVCGFFEVLIWIMVIGRILQDMGGAWANYLGYAAGFAIGNYVGISIENKLAMGMVALRVITDRPVDELIGHLKLDYHGVTSMAASGFNGEVHLVLAVIKRKDIDYFLNIVNRHNPQAYISIEDVRHLSSTYLPPKSSGDRKFASRMRFSLRKK
jgi:uncharacterized protein YebE (UPF0316 family)